MVVALGSSPVDRPFRARRSLPSPFSSSISPRAAVVIRGPLCALAAAFAVLTLAGPSPAQAEPTLYATSPESGNSYTDLYTLNTEGRVESYGALGFSVGGGLTPLTVPITGLTYGGGLLYATSPESGNSYTDLYTLNTEGWVESYGALGFSVGGGLAPLTVPITGLTYGEGSLYAISPELDFPHFTPLGIESL